MLPTCSCSAAGRSKQRLCKQHELENWRTRIGQEDKCAEKWEDWWGWMVKEEDRAKVGEVKGNMKSLINAKDMPTPAFAGSQFLKAHYDSMMPAEKFHTPTLESHKCGGALGVIGGRKPFEGTGQAVGANPLEPLGLSQRFGRVNARLETNDPL